MATYLPLTSPDMRQIAGVGDLKFDKYGIDFIQEIRTYCSKNNLQSRMHLKSPKRERKQRTKRDMHGKDTYHVSLDMFRSGKSMEEIALARNIGLSTVEGHLARFVTTGELRLDQIVPLSKIETIRKAIVNCHEPYVIGPVKTVLGEEYSYGEIRAVMASMQQF